jgi:hypothetical protein
MNILIITFELLKKFSSKSPESYPGVVRFLDNCVHAWIGGNSFIIRTKLNPDEVVAQLKPHLVQGEFLCVFTATQPASFFVPEFFLDGISKVLNEETSFEDTEQPSN